MTEKGSIYAITQQENGQPDINILVIESSNVCISGGNLMCNSDVSINRELICNNGTFTTINASSTISGNLIGNVTSSGTSTFTTINASSTISGNLIGNVTSSGTSTFNKIMVNDLSVNTNVTIDHHLYANNITINGDETHYGEVVIDNGRLMGANGTSIESMLIGANTPAAGTFTNISGTQLYISRDASINNMLEVSNNLLVKGNSRLGNLYYSQNSIMHNDNSNNVNAYAIKLSVGGRVRINSANDNDIQFRHNNNNTNLMTIKHDGQVEIPGTLKAGGNKFPTIYGSDGQVLKTNGTGTLSWVNQASNLPTDASFRDLYVNRDISINNNLIINGKLYGPSTFIIDPAAIDNNTGKVQIKGDLEVLGTQTTIHSTNLDICDNRIKLNGVNNMIDAGIDVSINNTTKSLLYESTGNRWYINDASLNIQGNLEVSNNITSLGTSTFSYATINDGNITVDQANINTSLTVEGEKINTKVFMRMSLGGDSGSNGNSVFTIASWNPPTISMPIGISLYVNHDDIFKAPRNGYYFINFSTSVRSYTGNSTYALIRLQKNSSNTIYEDVMISTQQEANDPNMNPKIRFLSVTTILYLSTIDKVRIRAQVDNNYWIWPDPHSMLTVYNVD